MNPAWVFLDHEEYCRSVVVAAAATAEFAGTPEGAHARPAAPRLKRSRLRLGLAALVLSCSGLGLGCESQVRCNHDVECPAGQVCSNDNDPRAPGLCLAPCDPHIATAACDGGTKPSREVETPEPDSTRTAQGGGAR